MREKKINLTYDDNFKKEVNFDFSSVHIPVEIYDGSEYQFIFDCCRQILFVVCFHKITCDLVIYMIYEGKARPHALKVLTRKEGREHLKSTLVDSYEVI